MYLWVWVQASLLISVYGYVVDPYKCTTKKPHIIYILADDMGWNDVSYHGSDQIPTPNMDSMAYQGVILNKHYVQPLCTPTRACLMTGKYPIHTGIHQALSGSTRVGLSLSEKILPQYLKDLGYTTNIIGKWHLGFYKKEFTPLQRGFDSHFGYYTGAVSYYDHINEDISPGGGKTYSGHDLRRNYTTAWDLVGQYATDLLTREAIDVIYNHNPNKPLFLYLPHLAAHAGNEGKWLEAPQEEIDRFSYISNPNRRTYAAMVSRLDKSIGAVVAALDRKNMLKNSIIVFISDNGAPNTGIYNNWGSNYPFRGQKVSLWEGGVRTPAFIWSPLIKNPSRVSNDLIHMTDWLPTLLSATGCNVNSMIRMNIDGVNQWPSISTGYPGPRKTMVVDINEERGMNSIIVNNFKYVKGAIPKGANAELSTFSNLYTIRSPKQPRYDLKTMYSSPAWRAMQRYSRDPYIWYKILKLRNDATVQCVQNVIRDVNCTNTPCLFDMDTDPCEQFNIANLYPAVLNKVQQLVESYKMGAVPSIPFISDPAANPDYFNGTWQPWVHQNNFVKYRSLY